MFSFCSGKDVTFSYAVVVMLFSSSGSSSSNGDDDNTFHGIQNCFLC
jgi:hypothetical protein